MQFTNDKAIYRQIVELVEEKILQQEWSLEDRIPSVRELGAAIEVNPNTVMRAYEKLQQEGIIYNKRGIGFFVATQARDSILKTKRRNFLTHEAPLFFKTAKLLSVELETLISLYKQIENHEKN